MTSSILSILTPAEPVEQGTLASTTRSCRWILAVNRYPQKGMSWSQLLSFALCFDGLKLGTQTENPAFKELSFYSKQYPASTCFWLLFVKVQELIFVALRGQAFPTGGEFWWLWAWQELVLLVILREFVLGLHPTSTSKENKLDSPLIFYCLDKNVLFDKEVWIWVSTLLSNLFLLVEHL